MRKIFEISLFLLLLSGATGFVFEYLGKDSSKLFLLSQAFAIPITAIGIIHLVKMRP